ncbi:MAG: aminopeptidase [Alphaproteobacteria bacterium]|nr:aminopeptidase [Alphaproteobacteria bacterium]
MNTRAIRDINPAFQDIAKGIEALATQEDSVWTDELRSLANDFSTPFEENPDDLLMVLQEAQRLLMIARAGLLNNSDIKQKIKNAEHDGHIPRWLRYESPPASYELQRSLADKIYNVHRLPEHLSKQPPYAALEIGENSKTIMYLVVERLLQEDILFNVEFNDRDFLHILLNHVDEKAAHALGLMRAEKFAPANTRISTGYLQVTIPVDDRKKQNKTAYAQGASGHKERVMKGDIHYTLTKIPTKGDAQRDHMSHQELTTLFFEMTDQPDVTGAQNILCEKFDAARTIRITNNDGTDIKMDLYDENGLSFTFCNSVTARNVPGSEIFSGVRRNTVNGTIVAKGRFEMKDQSNKTIENLTMTFKDGKIVSFSADSGAEYFQEFLDGDPNNYYIGELGIGTNAHLRRHVVNGMLVEKVGGSFHVALGDCFVMNEYGGKQVHVNNGNYTKTGDHWDITTLLRGKEGRIYLDDKLAMDNGEWLDARLAVLNEGWGTIPVQERPDYWKKFKGYYSNGHPIFSLH